MRTLGLVPTYADSPLDAFWLKVQRRYPTSTQLYGLGRPGYEAGAIPASGAYDLVLCQDPALPGSQYWQLKGIEAKCRAVILQDSCYGIERQAEWIEEQEIDLVLVRGKDDLKAVMHSINEYVGAVELAGKPSAGEVTVAWFPFGVDTGVFHEYPDVEPCYDVGIFGHLGTLYPVRAQIAVLLSQECAANGISFYNGVTAAGRPKLLGREYARMMAACKILVVVPPTPYRYVAQKYIEVGALGRCLLCTEPRHGFRDLGFEPNVNCRLFPEDGSTLLADLTGMLAAGSWKELAAALHQLVTTRHTNAHRLNQLEGWLAAYGVEDTRCPGGGG